jgi:hypothetical protein
LEGFGNFFINFDNVQQNPHFPLVTICLGGIIMEIIRPLKERIISIPNIEIGNETTHFFSVFLIQSIFFLLFAPVAISVPAFLLLHSFTVSSTFIAISIFSLGIIVLVTWMFVSILFFYSVTEPKTWPRYVALSWFIILVGTFITWILFLKTLF